MNQLNTLIVEGNAVDSATLSETAPNLTKCAFTLATNRYYKVSNNTEQEEVTYIDVEVYGEYAKSVARNVTKGRGVRVVGRVKQDRWTDSDGKPQSRMYAVAEHIECKPKPVKQDEAKDEPADNSGYLL